MQEAVTLANPKTYEYQVVRTSLLPGILKTISSNKHLPLPLKLFEVSDIVLRDESKSRRARNQRNVCFVYCGKTSGFEQIHGMLDRLMTVLNIPRSKGSDGYQIKESSNETYFPDRRADIYLGQLHIGSFGIIHPSVLTNFELVSPCSALELNLEPFI